MANGIRDNERNGRAQVVVVEEGSEPDAVTKVQLYTLLLQLKSRHTLHFTYCIRGVYAVTTPACNPTSTTSM